MVQSAEHDVLIFGGGPAGMTAAMWCAQIGMSPLLIDQKEQLGGQLLTIYNPIDNYPGVSTANGKELCDLFVRSIERCSFETRLKTRVIKVDLASKHILLESGESLIGRALIIATGVRRRKLGVEGEDKFAGRGILESGAGAKEKVRDKRVVIVGGGDAALENAVVLSDFAREVTLVHRRDSFSARDEFTNAVRTKENIRFELQTVVGQIVGNKKVEAVVVKKAGEADSYLLETDHVLIRIGVEPNSDLVKGQVEIDDQGYAVVDAACQSSFPGVFIAGDIANPASPTIATAVGMGAAAAKSACGFLSSDPDNTRSI